jgi:hypothetical protein
MTDAPKGERILFISAMPVSRSNAIGIQIAEFAKPFTPDWIHCYWDTNMGPSQPSNSHCLNSPVPRLWPFVAGRGFLTRVIDRFRLSWWHGDVLIESKKPRLRKLLRNVRFAHVAPLRNSEARRCREILETIECPFVVQIWDMVDATLNADYGWLFSHAERVFCLSPTMLSEVHQSASCETSIQSFVRARSKVHAKSAGANKLIIGLQGFLSPYQDGLRLLERAIIELRREFSEVHLKYMGPPGQLNFLPESLRGVTENLGLLDGDGVDKVLSDCNVGYIPGPLQSPEQDLRSRHSIPSRLADYMAIGLPVIAAVDAASATSILFSPIKDRGFFPVSSPEEICQAAQKLTDKEVWEQAARACSSFFDLHFDNEHALNELCSLAQRFLQREGNTSGGIE